MNGLIIGAMMALTMVQQTDTTFAVEGAEYLDVETLGGSIVVEVWDEDLIRVQAEHSSRTYVDIDRGRRGISVESEARRGPANIVDYRITVPRRMALQLEAQYGDITIEGSDGRVEVETLQGDITVRGGRGEIEVSSTMGNIFVEGADGTIEIESSAADIRIENSTGEIYAETAGGSIVLQNVDPRSVDVGSTGGRVHYAGAFRRGGTYFFGAHGGSLTIVVPEGSSAKFNVATVHGSITSTLEDSPQSFEKGQRHEFTLGEGGALVEAETYGGRIRLVRPGGEGSEVPARRVREARDRAPREARLGVAVPSIGESVRAQVTAEVRPEVTARVNEALSHVDWADVDHDMDFDFDFDHDVDFDFDFDFDHDTDFDFDFDFDHDIDFDHDWDGRCHDHDDEADEPTRIRTVR